MVNLLDKLNIERHEYVDDDQRSAVERETVIGIPVVGIELVVVDFQSNSKVYLRGEGETHPKYLIHPQEKVIDSHE